MLVVISLRDKLEYLRGTYHMILSDRGRVSAGETLFEPQECFQQKTSILYLSFIYSNSKPRLAVKLRFLNKSYI